MFRNILRITVLAVLPVAPIFSQTSTYYWGIIHYPLEANFRPLPPGDGSLRIGPPELYSTKDLQNAKQGQLTLFYTDDTIGTFSCPVEVAVVERSGHDSNGKPMKGKIRQAYFSALIPNYKPARGYRLMQDGILIREKFFPQPDQIPVIDVKEESTETGLNLQWNACQNTRYSTDEGKTWKMMKVGSPKEIPDKGLSTGGMYEFEILATELEKNPHPLIEFWVSQNLVLNRFQYRVGAGKPPVALP